MYNWLFEILKIISFNEPRLSTFVVEDKLKLRNIIIRQLVYSNSVLLVYSKVTERKSLKTKNSQNLL